MWAIIHLHLVAPAGRAPERKTKLDVKCALSLTENQYLLHHRAIMEGLDNFLGLVLTSFQGENKN